MSITKTSLVARVGVVVLGLAMVLTFAVVPSNAHAQLTSDQIQSILTLLASFGADQATINNVQSALNGQPTSGSGSGSGSSASVCPFTWTRNLSNGATGSDVLALQQFLNAEPATQLAASGPGSPGNETSFYGTISGSAVKRFQERHAAEILTPLGLTSGTQFFGPSTRSRANALCSVALPPPPPADDSGDDSSSAPADGTRLTVSPAVQPANGLAPADAARVPFTRFTVTAGSDGAVALDNVVVERQGPSADANFSGIVLLNADGTLVGTEKTLNSSHQARIGSRVVIPAGQSRTFTVAGNMAASANVNNGEVASLALVAINTSAAVSGSLPIVGASQTMNSTLSIGTISSTARGSFSPGSSRTEEVGTTDFNFTSVKLTAGSVEDVFLRSIRFEQTGSAGPEDLANVRVVISGQEYDVTRDGDFYTALFPGEGLLVPEGTNIDVTLRGDIVGGSAKTVDFDIDRRTDIHIVGERLGFGILPPLASSAAATDGGAFNNANNPYYDAFQVTVSAGTLTVRNDTSVGAQNIAVNQLNQPIAGFEVDVQGEPVTVDSVIFNFTVTGGNMSDLENVTLVDGNGTVIAGPTDGSGTAPGGTITLSDSVTFPEGITKVLLQARLSTDFSSNNTVRASTTPSSQWTSAEGEETGDSVTPAPSSAVSGPTMTVKAGALNISNSTLPPAQTIIAGVSNFHFADIILDATDSGEDVRITSLPSQVTYGGGGPDNLLNCGFWDGTPGSGTLLTSGSNLVDPTASTGSSETFTFDGNGVLVDRGTTRTLSLACDLSASATTSATYSWGLDSTDSITSVTGVESGTTVAEVVTTAVGQTMTVATSGSYTVANDTSLLYTIAQAGSTNVLLGAFQFEAGSSEDIRVKRVALELGNTASNSPADLSGQQVSLWSDGVQVGTAQFGIGSFADNATSSILNGGAGLLIPKDEFVTVEVRADLTNINTNFGTPGAFLTVNYDGQNNGLNGNHATGVSSGATIDGGTATDQTTNGLRIFRSIPTLADVTPTPPPTLAAGNDLYQLQVTAGSGRDLGIAALGFDIATTGATVTGFQIFGPAGAVNATVANVDGLDGAQTLYINFDAGAVDRRVKAGQSKVYKLRATTVTGLTAANTESLNVNLRADNAYPSFANLVGKVVTIATTTVASATNNLIWTAFSTTTPADSSAAEERLDWSNGYGVPGFPSVGQDMPVRVFSE